MRAVATLAGLLLLAAACAPVPRPFDRAPAPGGPVLPAHLGNDSVLVLPVSGTPGDGGLALAGEVAARLRDSGIPATARPDGGGGMRIAGAIENDGQPADGAIVRIAITWELRSRTGATETLETIGAVPAGEWALASPLALSQLAAASVPDLLATLRPDAPAPPPATDSPPVALWKVDGAPGDGSAALTAAMRHALQKRGVSIATGQDGAAVLLGSVHRIPAGPGREEIEVLWTLIRPDGSELGRVRQANTLPVGRLDGVWGPVAGAVAEAGADAIAALIDETVAARAGTAP